MQVLNLIREFEMQKMKESETIKEYSDKLLGIVNKVRLLGTDFSDSTIVQKILGLIPEKFEATISSLENSKDLSLSELLNALQAQEQRRLMRQEGYVEGAFLAKSHNNGGKNKKQKQNNNKKPGDSGKNNNNNKSNNTQVFPTCPYCKKTNHIHKKYWWRPNARCHKRGQLGHMERICKIQQHGESKATKDQS